MTVRSVGQAAIPMFGQPTLDPDVALVRRVAAGDQAAHRLLYERWGRAILSYLIGRLGDPQVAEDLLQEVMLELWRTAGRFRGDSRVSTWLLGMAHHQACNHLRRPSVRRPATALPADGPTVLAVEGTPTAETLDLAAALTRLSDDHRVVLELVFYHGLSVAEAAGVLGLPPGTVKSRLHRARAHVRADLDRGRNSHV